MMIRCLLTVAVLAVPIGCGVYAETRYELSAGLQALAPEVLVVAGKGAPAVEWAAATQIAEAFRAAGGPQDNLLDDEGAFTDLDRTAFSHLVLVGTYGSNELLRQQWGHSAVDRAAFAKETVLPANAARPPFYEGAPDTGFYVHGYGTFRKSTGYVTGGRNDLYLVPAAVGAPKTPPYRIRISVAGSDSAGVDRAAHAFLDGSMLGGVLPGEKLPKQGDALILGKDRYATELPEFFPRENLLGWIQPDATEYAGFLQASGKPALRMWRAKYLPDAKSIDFAGGPHRRASGNEILVAEMKSPEEAQAALDSLIAVLSVKPQSAKGLLQYWKDRDALRFAAETKGNAAIQRTDGFTAAAVGKLLLMTTLPEPQASQSIDSLIAATE